MCPQHPSTLCRQVGINTSALAGAVVMDMGGRGAWSWSRSDPSVVTCAKLQRQLQPTLASQPPTWLAATGDSGTEAQQAQAGGRDPGSRGQRPECACSHTRSHRGHRTVRSQQGSSQPPACRPGRIHRRHMVPSPLVQGCHNCSSSPASLSKGGHG